MGKKHTLGVTDTNDQLVRWTMRIVGAILAMTASVLLAHDIFNGTLSVGFLGVCIGLGVITVITSYLPETEKARLTEQPVRS